MVAEVCIFVMCATKHRVGLSCLISWPSCSPPPTQSMQRRLRSVLQRASPQNSLCYFGAVRAQVARSYIAGSAAGLFGREYEDDHFFLNTNFIRSRSWIEPWRYAGWWRTKFLIDLDKPACWGIQGPTVASSSHHGRVSSQNKRCCKFTDVDSARNIH